MFLQLIGKRNLMLATLVVTAVRDYIAQQLLVPEMNQTMGQLHAQTTALLLGAHGHRHLSSFDGSESDVYVVTRTNLNNTGSDIAGYLVTSDEQLTTSKGDVTELIGIQSFANPVVVTKDFKGINFAFGVNQGSHIWDSDGGSTVKIEAGG